MTTWSILVGDAVEKMRGLPDASVQCCVTSPPYWGLRDYGVDGQIGLEKTPDEFVRRLVDVFREVRRVLRDDGTYWVNLGDSYAGGVGIGRNDAGRDIAGGGGNRLGSGNPGRQGSFVRDSGLKPKDIVGIPWRTAFALQADGWYLRSDIIWAKPNPMPESVTDRPTKAHEYVFLLTKSDRYFYDADAIAENAVSKPKPRTRPNGVSVVEQKQRCGGVPDCGAGTSRNARTVWTIASQPYAEAHFATFPEELPRRCILAGTKPGDTVLDPFNGSGTTGAVATALGRSYIGIELNPEYSAMAKRRIEKDGAPLFAKESV